MIRIFYEPTTGDIIRTINKVFVNPFDESPFIEVENEIRICDWKVNLETKQLEPSEYVPSNPNKIVINGQEIL